MSDGQDHAQAQQADLLEKALKQPGVAVAAETYSGLAAYVPAAPYVLASSGYAVGGNVS